MAIRIDILTLFPEMFGPVLGTSIPKRAAEKGLVSYHLTNVRDFATDAHKSVDDKPFGGGPLEKCPLGQLAGGLSYFTHGSARDRGGSARGLLTC